MLMTDVRYGPRTKNIFETSYTLSDMWEDPQGRGNVFESFDDIGISTLKK